MSSCKGLGVIVDFPVLYLDRLTQPLLFCQHFAH